MTASVEWYKKHDGFQQMWTDDKHEQAETLRNRAARRLRREGWTVQCWKSDFTDLARMRAYCLEANREKAAT